MQYGRGDLVPSRQVEAAMRAEGARLRHTAYDPARGVTRGSPVDEELVWEKQGLDGAWTYSKSLVFDRSGAWSW